MQSLDKLTPKELLEEAKVLKADGIRTENILSQLKMITESINRITERQQVILGTGVLTFFYTFAALLVSFFVGSQAGEHPYIIIAIMLLGTVYLIYRFYQFFRDGTSISYTVRRTVDAIEPKDISSLTKVSSQLETFSTQLTSTLRTQIQLCSMYVVGLTVFLFLPI